MAQEKMENSTLLKTAALLVIGVLTVHIMIETQFILLPLVWAVFIALLILPLTEKLEHIKFPRWLAIITVLLVVTVLVGFILYLLSVQVAGLLGDIPAVTSTLSAWTSELQHLLEIRLGISHELLTQQALNSISQFIQTGLTEVRNSLYSVFRIITVISVIPLYIFFMLYYRDQFYRGTIQLAVHYQQTQTIFNKIMKVVQQYLRGLVIVTLIVAVLFYIVLTLFDIKFAFFFAVFLALFNLIPYIGVFISSVVVVLYSLATSGSLFYPVGVLISLWLIQLLENNLITPYVVGSQVKLNPLVALIAIFAGASIWGVSGMILFIPIVGVLKVIFDEFEQLKPIGVLLGKP
ncbi:AI-2E family transporter [Rhodohalobacter sulfatireducens]|uniref:AI-2E family transporter n=1 Tax=Rhodohalobacter sulfatireducens TaxID=2911366 RepID=A0ABS9KDD3_9BACT|nr:AI-2E family transporter [Rhodohalobacter sulfatireducens]MCG2588840.1 AI-2E family transporter [Rhodohalobacter sulfatireducens]MDR9364308.1 AI-2E family transporter [Balneolaceae bacterium]MDR9408220.1 AI-2E family transporter [Balneolaceae bacterium]